MISRKVIFGVSVVLSLLVGLIVGLLWKDVPGLKLNKEIKVYEIASILLTMMIGFYVPLLIKKWIDDSKSVKSSLVEEVKIILVSLTEMKSKIKSFYENGSVTNIDKDAINYAFHSIELQLQMFKSQLAIAFPADEKGLVNGLVDNYNKYKDYLTGGQFMISTFTQIDDRFLREHNQELSVLEGQLKNLIHKLYRL